ncbi:MAG: DUF4435 domain-containing protein [Alloprevotella sp.]|nr:DUF4435 domain-containing protein [Alloprevotella sp.]
MPSSLTDNISSAYVEAMNSLNGKKRQRIVAFVESYDDVSFWSNLLRPLETANFYFEVMLPSKKSLGRGKKDALARVCGENKLGKNMIACVDADYDFLMQGATQGSRRMIDSACVFHTYVYAIENYECYAPGLHNVCVMSTLNDRHIFDFEHYVTEFSKTIWPLFTWSIWCYRYGQHGRFTMSDFARAVEMPKPDTRQPEKNLEKLRHKVNSKMAWLQRNFPQAKKTLKPLQEELRNLGVQPETAYLFMRGHDLADSVIIPLLESVCERLRREKENEIRYLSVHDTQRRNEIAAYQHAVTPVSLMMKKQTYYSTCPYFQSVQATIRKFLEANNGGESKKQ